MARAGACHGLHSMLCSYPSIWVGRGANGCKSQTTFARHFLLVDTHGLTAERLSPTPRCPLTPGSFGVTQRRHGAPACVTAARLTTTETSTVLLKAVGAGGCQGQYTRQVVSYITPLSVHDRCYYHVATLLCFPPHNTFAPLHQSARSPIITHNLLVSVGVVAPPHSGCGLWECGARETCQPMQFTHPCSVHRPKGRCTTARQRRRWRARERTMACALRCAVAPTRGRGAAQVVVKQKPQLLANSFGWHTRFDCYWWSTHYTHGLTTPSVANPPVCIYTRRYLAR